MKKIIILSFLVFGIQGCGNKSGDSAPGPTVERSEANVVKAVCFKNGKVVLDDTSAYDPKTDKAEDMYKNSEEDVSVDNCVYSYYK